MKNLTNKLSKAITLSLVLSLLVVGIALAFTDSALVKGYRINFISVEKSADGFTTTWTYAITDQEADSPGNGLSHWVFGICTSADYQIVSPPAGPIYTTPTNLDACVSDYNCVAADYNVEYGFDPTTGVDGIKFENLSEQLEGGSPPNTHIFQIDLYSPTGEFRAGDTDIAVKTGGADQYQIGEIYGPICSPTAVNLVDFQSPNPAAASMLPLLVIAGALAMLSGGTLVALRRRVS